MAKSSRYSFGLLVAFLLFFTGLVLVGGPGLYGLTLFMLLPMALGALSSWLFRPATRWSAAAVGGLGAGACAASLLAFGLEGAACILMALPLVLPLGAAGGLLAHAAMSGRFAARGATMLLLLPAATLTWDAKAKPPVYEVRSAVEIAASPEQVWKYVIAFPPLPAPHEWIFHAGVAYPQRAHIDGVGPGAVRRCEFSTGPFVEPIEVWDAPRLLRFRVTENPAPMQEWSPYGPIEPRHLHGYLISRQGEFRLTRLPNGHTLLAGTTWYQHGLWPAPYWRLWSDAIIHRIHLRVLNHVRALAEQESAVAGE